MTGDRTSAPKADALPGCATPRLAGPRRFSGDSTQAERGLHGNEGQNAAGTGGGTPGIVPNRYEVRPITTKAAIKWVFETHRHLPDIQGGLFAASVWDDHRPVAVGIAGNPARVWQGTGRIVISRVAAIELPFVYDSGGNMHPAPACTMIYRSLCDAARALGYREAWTYTLPGENGSSLRAAGFLYMGETKGEEWDRPSRARQAAVSPTKKGRWCRPLTREARRQIEQKEAA